MLLHMIYPAGIKYFLYSSPKARYTKSMQERILYHTDAKRLYIMRRQPCIISPSGDISFGLFRLLIRKLNQTALFKQIRYLADGGFRPLMVFAAGGYADYKVIFFYYAGKKKIA